MPKSSPERFLIALVLLGFLTGLGSLRSRLRAETANKTTEILLDFEALVDWQTSLDDLGDGLPKKLLQAGVGSLAFSELHLDDLIERGLVTALNVQEFDLALKGGGLVSVGSQEFVTASLFHVGRGRTGHPGCYLMFADPELARQIHRSLSITVGPEVSELLGGKILWVPMSVRHLRLRSLGFDLATIEQWQKQGFKVWLRPENSAGLTPEQITKLFTLWSEVPDVQGVIFGGALNEAIGYPDALEVTTEELKRLQWKVGYIELPERAQQLGIETLVRELPQQTARVMAVSPAHQAKLSSDRVLGMYSLGSRERNLRVLYVRPYAVPGRAELDEEFLFGLKDEVNPVGEADTFKLASAAPHPLAVAVMALGAGALAWLLTLSLGLPVGVGLGAIFLVLPVLGFGGAALVGRGILFRSLLALAIGMAGPLWTFLRIVYPSVLSAQEPENQKTFAEGLKLLAATSLASLCTGLWVAALLTDTTFLLGLDRFRGVKLLTLVTPMLIVLGFLWKRYSLDQWMAGLLASVRVYQAVAAGAVLAAFGLLLLRTGNDAGGAASDSERQLRLVLDQVLGVRPRFKEFLIAHPALICTPLLARVTGFLPSLLLVLVAAIGQAGIVDTFAHVHTPLVVTLIRVLLGVGLGVLFGGLGYLIVRFLLTRLAKSFPTSGEGVEEDVK